jgi:quercetin dioxygenase-like cupin family protein
VLSGELTVIVNGKETVLEQGDSCVIESNENREIINRSNDVCTILVAVARGEKRVRGRLELQAPPSEFAFRVVILF